MPPRPDLGHISNQLDYDMNQAVGVPGVRGELSVSSGYMGFFRVL